MKKHPPKGGVERSNAMVPFNEFPKIPRLKRNIVITEKIDGTNASILVPEDDGRLLVGSRGEVGK